MNMQNVMTGILSALMACTGGAVLIVSTAEMAGFTSSELISWLFAVYFLGGLLNLTLSIVYKIPFGGAHSITAAAFLSMSGIQFSVQELAGASIMAGIFIAVFGISGLSGKLLALLPKPLMDAMLAGLIFTHIVKIVPALKDIPFVGGLAVIGFFLLPKLNRKLPPVLGVLSFGLIGLFLGYDFPAWESYSFAWPTLIQPVFTVNSFFSLALPLALLVLSNDVFVALAALRKNGYDPSVVKTITVTGIATSIAGWLGGHAVNIGGMMSMLCSSSEAGPKEKRYLAGVVSGVLVSLFGLFSWKVLSFIHILPLSFIVIITGFSLLGVFISSLHSAFSVSSYRYATAFTFAIAVANVSFLGISAPIWCLLVGLAAAKLLGEGERTLKEG
ncbi:benzoate/H(+) symporter BenE family transporter [Paenibacillus eucommiae]|uniref:Benzoate membrane transport protein n=1 Tax=Paenibacillus eucommiae TaxID=1355755 RepID=A0ABS4J8G3_9BACL|nr:benzoate/H(+) symporter BenE family transporter [Paenibacillus eucommiae]MBP1995551.1 benzoate membrane transport protein [Paenibacillus eucommiae]